MSVALAARVRQDARTRIQSVAPAGPMWLPECAYAHCSAAAAAAAHGSGSSAAAVHPAVQEREILRTVAGRLDAAAMAVDALANARSAQPLDPAAIMTADHSCRALVLAANAFLA
eukprot:COSAG01_NODE_24620_length_772_cov_7.576523_1_plen_114_part_10